MEIQTSALRMASSTTKMNLEKKSTWPSTRCSIRSTPISTTLKNATMHLTANSMNCWSQTGRLGWTSGLNCSAPMNRRTVLQVVTPPHPATKTQTRRTKAHKRLTRTSRSEGSMRSRDRNIYD